MSVCFPLDNKIIWLTLCDQVTRRSCMYYLHFCVVRYSPFDMRRHIFKFVSAMASGAPLDNQYSSHTLLPVTTTWYRLIQVSTGYYKLVPVSTVCYFPTRHASPPPRLMLISFEFFQTFLSYQIDIWGRRWCNVFEKKPCLSE